MKDDFADFEDFFKKYEAFEKQTVDDIIRKFSSTKSELKHTISCLIDHRYKRRDCELERLDARASRLLKRLEAVQIQRVLEEILCFKDVLSLQKRLTENDKSHN